VKIKHLTTWVAYLDSWQGKTLIITYLDDKGMVMEWLKKIIVSREITAGSEE
jgi:hypothetical protein